MSLMTGWCVWMLVLIALERWTAAKAREFRTWEREERERELVARRARDERRKRAELAGMALDIQECSDGWVRVTHPDYPMYMGIGLTANEAALSLLCKMERGDA